MLELPYLALAKTLPAEQPLTEGRASLSSRLRRVEVLTLQNRLREAGKILCSHGIVPASEDGYKRLSKLHPALKETIPSLSTDVPQFFITPLQAAKALHKLCGEKWVSLDPFGWSTALLHLVRGSRGVTAESPITFFRLFATLVSKVAAAEVSDLVAFVLSSGSVLALNKDSEEERKTRETKGLPPRERPINQGSMVLQMAFGLALSSDPAKKAMHELRPTQQGVGAERGMELIAHSCSAHYQEGNFAILKLDATNGFQELKRASLHQKVLQRCPSLLCLFQKYYTAESMCFYSMGRAGTRLLRSREGARIGCKLGSFAFALTVQDMYLTMQEFLDCSGSDPNIQDGSFVKAAMDDCLLVIRADKSDEKALYDRIAWGIKLLNKHAKRLGLNFANDKAQLLLPQDWVPPTAGLPEGLVVRSNTLLNVEQQGIEVVGCPVGSIDFRQTFVQRNLGDVLRSRDDLKQLHPQCATRLLLQCVSACPAYIAQVVHPSATKEALTTFDDNMWSFLLEFLGGIGGDNQLKCCPEGLSRARFRAQLPCRLGGAGLRSWERTADFAWFTSVASCVAESDPNLDVGRAHFGALAHIAYEAAIDSLGGTSHPKVTSDELIPGDDPDVLTVSNFYKELFMDSARVNKTPLRLQKEFSAVTAQNAADELLSKSEGAHVSDSERITLLSKSPIMSHLFTADLSNIETRLSKTEFIISVRHFCVFRVSEFTLMNPIG